MVSFKDWRTSQRYLRIQHNKRVNRWFKLAQNSTGTRTDLRNALLIYAKDSAQQITAKITYFNSIKLEYLQVDSYTIPEGWELKAGQNIPQLAIVYRPTNKKNRSGNYVTHIPHYKGNKSPKFTDYTKGNYWGRLVLKDNSQIRVNASTEAQAKLIINQLKKYVDPKFRTDNLKFGSYGRKIYKEIAVKPVRADYYEHGKEQSYPTWQKFF